MICTSIKRRSRDNSICKNIDQMPKGLSEAQKPLIKNSHLEIDVVCSRLLLIDYRLIKTKGVTKIYLGLMGQAEKMMEETKAKAAELQEMAMEKVNNCKVS